MSVFFKTTQPKAKKDYWCDACRTIRDAYNDADILTLTEQEQKDFAIAKEHGFKILKGEEYVCQPQVYDGIFATFRGIPAMTDICQKYDLFDHDY